MSRPEELTRAQIEKLESIYGNRFLLEAAPDHKLPKHGMSAQEAKGLVEQETVLDGLPTRNLATFVTTWMEPEADELIRESLRVNFIDHAEYPQSAEIEQRCIRMLADLFNAPGETTGARTQGSSEAIMLGALSLKWKWRARREAAGKATDRPNLVFGGDVHVVWEKFCRYFDVDIDSGSRTKVHRVAARAPSFFDSCPLCLSPQHSRSQRVLRYERCKGFAAAGPEPQAEADILRNRT